MSAQIADLSKLSERTLQDDVVLPLLKTLGYTDDEHPEGVTAFQARVAASLLGLEPTCEARHREAGEHGDDDSESDSFAHGELLHGQTLSIRADCLSRITASFRGRMNGDMAGHIKDDGNMRIG
jgi:hypothetical protein